MLKPEEMMQAQAGLATLTETGPVWLAFMAVLESEIFEANEFATHPDTPEDKRAGWAGRERGLRDFKTELNAVRSGKWRDRAEYSDFFKRMKDELKEED